jgi:hypothetical protein
MLIERSRETREIGGCESLTPVAVIPMQPIPFVHRLTIGVWASDESGPDSLGHWVDVVLCPLGMG